VAKDYLSKAEEEVLKGDGRPSILEELTIIFKSALLSVLLSSS